MSKYAVSATEHGVKWQEGVGIDKNDDFCTNVGNVLATNAPTGRVSKMVCKAKKIKGIPVIYTRMVTILCLMIISVRGARETF